MDSSFNAGWTWTPPEGPVEIPYQRVTLTVTRHAHSSSLVTVDGLCGNAGESITFDILDLLDAAGMTAGLVSVTGTRNYLLKREAAS